MPGPFAARSGRCQTKISWGVSSITGTEKPRSRFCRLRQRHALDWHTLGKGGEKARWHGPIEHDEDAVIVGAANQPAIGLPQPQSGDPVRIFHTAKHRFASPVEYIRTRPGNPVENEQAQRAAWDVDPVAHGVGAEQAGILLSAKDVDERRS